jgi:hypothetical protein
MTKLTKLIGLLLCLVSILSFTIAGFATESLTSLIAAAFGLPLFACGYLTEKQPERRKIYMHVALALVILCLGGISPRLGAGGSLNKQISLWTVFFLCILLLVAYVNSFIQARKQKED